MENIGWGLQMTVLGMGLVFSLLAMLWGLLTLVLKFDKEPEPVPAEQVQVEAERIAAEADDAMVFHAGTVLDDAGVVRTSGGRVLCVTVLADSVRQAQQRVYDVTRGIHFDGMQYRRDIGHRAIKS